MNYSIQLNSQRKHFPRLSLKHILKYFFKAFPVPRFPFFHSSIMVLIIAFYYLFGNVLFTTYYREYMTYEKIIDLGDLFKTNSSICHVLNKRDFTSHFFSSKYSCTKCFPYEYVFARNH